MQPLPLSHRGLPGDLVLLAAERTVTVTREEHHQDVLAGRTGPAIAELRPCTITAGKHAGQDGLEVVLDGRRVGELTRLMAQRYRPGISMLGGGGGALRHSTNHHTAPASRSVASALRKIRRGVGSGVTRARLLVDERVDLLGDLEVEVGEAAFAVGGKPERHLAVADVDVGMMVVFLGDLGDAVDELDGLGKVIELENAFNMLFVVVPVGQFLEPRFDILSGKQVGHKSVGLGVWEQ